MTERLVVSCGEDCTLTVIRLLRDGSVMVSHVLQGHVSRVRCVSIAGSLLLSGSDDRQANILTLNTERDMGDIMSLLFLLFRKYLRDESIRYNSNSVSRN